MHIVQLKLLRPSEQAEVWQRMLWVGFQCVPSGFEHLCVGDEQVLRHARVEVPVIR